MVWSVARLLWRSRLPIAALLLLLSGFFFVQSTRALSSYPSADAFDGWATVLLPATQIDTPDQYRLETMPVSGGDKPAMAYSLVVCGARPTRGWILLGGNARLDDVRLLGDGVTSQERRSIRIRSELGEEEPARTMVQVFGFALENPGRCVPKNASRLGMFSGSLIRIQGRALAPTVRIVKDWPFQSPRQVLALPNTGGIPGISGSSVGAFKAPALSPAELIRPPILKFSASGGVLEVLSLIESARPPVVAGPQVAWSSSVPIQPIVVSTSPPSAARLQSWASVTGLIAGTLFGLLLSLLFEAARPHSLPDPAILASRPRAKEPRESTPERAGWIRWLAIASLGVWMTYLLRRRRER